MESYSVIFWQPRFSPRPEKISWSPNVFYTKLACKVYRYDRNRLKEVKYPSKGEHGTEVGKRNEVNVIFSHDFTQVKAILPKTRLSDPIEQDGFEFNEVGFTLVTLKGQQRCLPYLKGSAGESTDSAKRIIVYSKVPSEFKKAFEQLIQ